MSGKHQEVPADDGYNEKNCRSRGASADGGAQYGRVLPIPALMSIGNLSFVVTALLANWATTQFYVMEGR